MITELATRAFHRLQQSVRDLAGNQPVTRTVHGARLVLPRSNRLPDYVAAFPEYGVNLVRLAEALHAGPEPLTVLDLGANVGDSALQILVRVDARILCVDGDPHWLPYLARNTGDDPRVTVEAALIVEQPGAATLTAVRDSVTTRFVESTASDGTGQLSPAELRARHPEFGMLDLLKSDVDGHDCALVPLLAAEWADSAPTLFFEYDPALTRSFGNDAPERVWDDLAALGYESVAVWTNVGEPRGCSTVAELRALAPELFQATVDERGYHYWDVAVAHGSKHEARRILHDLVPGHLGAAPPAQPGRTTS